MRMATDVTTTRRRPRTGRGGRRSTAGGFTLIELMIALALTSILVAVMGFVFQQSRIVVVETDLRIRNFRGAQVAMELLATDLEHIYPVANTSFGLAMAGTVYANQGAANEIDLHADRIRFVTFRDDLGNNQRRYFLVDYQLQGIGQPANPVLRRSIQEVQITPGTGVELVGTAQLNDLADNVIDFRIEFAMDQADPLLAGPNRLSPAFRDPDAGGGPTDGGAFFFYATDVDAAGVVIDPATLRNSGLEAQLDIPNAVTGGNPDVFDFVRPFDIVRIQGTNLPFAEYTIRQIDRGADPVVVHLMELPPIVDDVTDVAYVIHVLPAGVRATIGTTARGTPRGSLVQTIWLR